MGLPWWCSIESACSAGDPGSASGPGSSPGEGMAIHFSTLAWKIPWTEESCRPQCLGLQRVRHDWVTSLHFTSVYSCHLFLISSASVRSISFLSFIVPIFAWNFPLVSNFLEEISSLSHSIVFLYFFALISEEGFLISPCSSLELCIQVGISFLFSFAFCFSTFHSCL